MDRSLEPGPDPLRTSKKPVPSLKSRIDRRAKSDASSTIPGIGAPARGGLKKDRAGEAPRAAEDIYRIVMSCHYQKADS